MRRLLCLVLALMLLAAAVAEAPDSPRQIDPDALAQNALVLIESLLMCPSAVSFEGEPPADLMREAVCAYRSLSESNQTDEEILQLIFARASTEAYTEGAPSPALLPVTVEIDSALPTGAGTVKVSVTAYTDSEGEREFYCIADVYLLPDEAGALSRVCALFFPD